MVGAMLAAVGGERRRKRIGAVVWHVAGLAVGASVLALAAAMIGLALPLPRRETAVVLGAAALLWGIASLRGRPLPLPSRVAQVPSAWSYTMTPSQFMFGYGVGLGLGGLTRIVSFSFYAFVGIVVLAADPLIALVAAQVYAAARGAPIVLAAITDRPAEDIIAFTSARRTFGLRLDAVLLTSVGFALISEVL